MLKKDVINCIAEKMPYFLKGDIAQAVDILIDGMVEALTEGRRVEIRGFGSLSIRERQGKSVPNPKTGVIMHIPARKSLHFTMSKSLKEPLIKIDS
ncbi:MAG: integration host factor subunit beta [Deltaproteobacteria bacterium]|nr:integration host factor subunit beta [Deltaproteobacteria bacterium]